MSEFLLLSRGQWDADRSPEQIQGAIDAFYAWFGEQAAAGVLRAGSRLGTGCRLVTRERVLDGPFTEAKEIIGGYWFITAGSLDEAARIASRNPCLASGLSFEIRPLEAERASAFRDGNETPSGRAAAAR
ncbi:MAG: hypothetical protein ABS53_12600 [Hydrogenophaga sp. SCN 70-13]|uniref:YciI family protein n=1 Tax=unclassified Hydrogenophaga TaxID=2610897 RepID=UPI00086925E3|nr:MULTISPECIES: YciI family protein [unclassified Hydrogenophaga]MBN9372744.1 hypothetical protein [Hydrogenophaga sp.]ODT30048.1 MAG: hypothetical protein ABS53_12600 [Hydrogenophaga sp. SCN 70-13]OJV71551.1 MAG: hypothetical protein BGO22_02515 [Hydrogenophaga sp. 70-12]